MKSRNKTALCTLFLLAALATGCSSSQQSGGDGGEPMLVDPAMESGADAVGSQPEDMLASEDKPSTDQASALATEATNTSDPFSDLTEKKDDAAADGASSVASGDQTIEAPAAEASAPASNAEYVVKHGDTLMKIAFSIYGDIDRWKDLKDWNKDVKHWSHLKAGTKLTYEVPAQPFHVDELSHSYMIKHGDTLAGIADDVYGRRSKYKKLQGYNKDLVKNVNHIFAGFTLFYEITPKEMAEAEARHQQKASNPINMGNASDPVPSAVSPPPMDLTQPASPPPVAMAPASVAPSAPPAPMNGPGPASAH